MLHYAYSIALGLMVAILVTVGVLTFYPAPKYPTPPTPSQTVYDSGFVDPGEPSKAPDPEVVMAEAKYTYEMAEFDKRSLAYNTDILKYSENNLLITLSIAALLVLAALVLLKKYSVLPEGLLVGSLLLIYNNAERLRFSQEAYSPMVFAVVVGAFAIMAAAGYLAFVKKK